MEEIKLLSSGARAVVRPQGAYVTHYDVVSPKTHTTLPILYQGETIKRTGIPLLFPFAGPLDGGIFKKTHLPMPQHGFARESEWRVIHASRTQVTLELTHKDIHKDMHAAYPYIFTAHLTVALIQQGVLEYTLKISNEDTLSLPLAPGIHPYFFIPHDKKTELVLEGVEGFEAKEIDWNNIERNSRFYPFSGAVTIHAPNYTLTLEDNGFCNTLVVWSTDDKKDFVCIEPITRPFNSINTNPILVEPHSLWELKYVFTPRL